MGDGWNDRGLAVVSLQMLLRPANEVSRDLPKLLDEALILDSDGEEFGE